MHQHRTWMLIAVIFIIAQNWEQKKWPLGGEGYTHTMGRCSGSERNPRLTNTRGRIPCILLGERKQPHWVTNTVVPPVRHSQKAKPQSKAGDTGGLEVGQDKQTDAWGKVWGEGDAVLPDCRGRYVTVSICWNAQDCTLLTKKDDFYCVNCSIMDLKD